MYALCLYSEKTLKREIVCILESLACLNKLRIEANAAMDAGIFRLRGIPYLEGTFSIHRCRVRIGEKLHDDAFILTGK